MQRREFTLSLMSALALGRAHAATEPWAAAEARTGGRFGVAVLQADGSSINGQRLDERFPMCSTFKWLAAAYVLHRVDRGQERLDRRIRFGRKDLLPNSPVTSLHTREGMTLGELCRATITTSDNAAGNLILDTYGGPAALTRYARSLGDSMTRLDRKEIKLNEGAPGDPRDTTSPRAMARLMHAHLLGNALSPAGRAQLAEWLEATETNGLRLRADLPAGWRMGSKTGTGANGSTNDVGIFWPPGGKPPVIVAAYLTGTSAPEAQRHGAIADMARHIHATA